MLLKRLIEQWPLGMLLAVLLAAMPLLNWLGIALAVLLLMRRGMWYSTLAYVLVAVACYWAFSAYSIRFLAGDWAAILAMFLPLWVMAVSLRTLRALNLAFELGFAAMVVCLLLQLMAYGEPNLQAWLEFFRCRAQAIGMTEASLMAATTGQNFEQAVKGLMLGWPFAFFLMQVGILFLARWLQSRMYYPGGFQTEFHQLRLHKPVALGLAVLLLLLSLFGTQQILWIQLATIGLLVLAIPGLAFIHWYVKFKNLNVLWLVAVYGLLFISSFATMPLLAMIAVLDSGLNLRLRLNKR